MPKSSNALAGISFATGLLATSLLATPASAASADMRGVWKVAVTLVDCGSGAALAPPFTSLLSFAGDFTESETTNNPALALGQRSTAFGVWSKTGAGTYAMTSYALILFSSSGPHPIQAGSQQISQAIKLSGNSWTSKATIQFFDLTGAPSGSGCATAAASRLSL